MLACNSLNIKVKENVTFPNKDDDLMPKIAIDDHRFETCRLIHRLSNHSPKL